MQLVINRCYTYLLPMLDWWDERTLINNQLRGVFLSDKDCPELDNHIFVLYEFTGQRWFTSFEQVMKDSDYFITSYEPDKRHVMFVYEVPPHQQVSYDMFKDSRYSKISEQLKQRIVQFHGPENTKRAKAVMYREESMFVEWEQKINEGLPNSQHIKIPRDQEASDALHMENESFDKSMTGIDKTIVDNKEFSKEEGVGYGREDGD